MGGDTENSALSQVSIGNDADATSGDQNEYDVERAESDSER